LRRLRQYNFFLFIKKHKNYTSKPPRLFENAKEPAFQIMFRLRRISFLIAPLTTDLELFFNFLAVRLCFQESDCNQSNNQSIKSIVSNTIEANPQNRGTGVLLVFLHQRSSHLSPQSILNLKMKYFATSGNVHDELGGL